MSECKCISDNLDVFVYWPKESMGYKNELTAVRLLNSMCAIFGYGRIYQLMSDIHRLWCNEDELQKLKEEKEEFFKRNSWQHE